MKMDQLSPSALRRRRAGVNPRDNIWSDEDKQKLVKLFSEGYSQGAIVKEMPHKTRGAVAGQINRLRIKLGITVAPRRASGKSPKVVVEKRPPRIAKMVTVEKPKRVRLVMVDSDTRVTHNELEAHHCRWPIGDPRRSDFRFCGAPRISTDLKTPYCPEHTKLGIGRHMPAPNRPLYRASR
jgi:GcrA cell cycle regulator